MRAARPRLQPEDDLRSDQRPGFPAAQGVILNAVSDNCPKFDRVGGCTRIRFASPGGTVHFVDCGTLGVAPTGNAAILLFP